MRLTSWLCCRISVRHVRKAVCSQWHRTWAHLFGQLLSWCARLSIHEDTVIYNVELNLHL